MLRCVTTKLEELDVTCLTRVVGGRVIELIRLPNKLNMWSSVDLAVDDLGSLEREIWL